MRISDWSSDVCSSDLAHRRQVAPGFRHRLHAASLGVGDAIARRAVAAHGQRLLRVLHPHHRGVAAGPERRVAHDEGIVLDRKSVVSGKRVSVRVTFGGGGTMKKKTTYCTLLQI